MYTIKTYNQISNRGLRRFPTSEYTVSGEATEADAIMLRSHKLSMDEVGSSRAVARAGAGTNNVPVAECTERGVVVFNTPGANANAVKELVLCGLLLASRGIIPGIAFAESQAHLSDHGELSKLMEQEKKRFAGSEIAGKTLGVVGLGAIGSLVAEMAIGLGMKVNGFDPALSVEAAWRLPSKVKRIESLSALVANSNFITLHLPAIDATRGLINDELFDAMRPGTCLINFARDEIVDAAALLRALNANKLRRYVCDFPRRELMGRDDVIAMPHIGASTQEAEENCAIMAADQLMDFLENGHIRNSVNFPTLTLDRAEGAARGTRLAISNRNVPKMLGQILAVLADQNINVLDMINKSRDEIAYNLIDLESEPSADSLAAIAAIDNVIKVTLI